MTTELKEAKEVTNETVPPAVKEPVAPDRQKLHAELNELLEFKKKRVPRKGLTPCPSCTTLVDIDAKECPHCSSSIAANNALVRESMRRLREIEAELNDEHDQLDKSEPTEKQGFWGRLRNAFSSSPQSESLITPVLEYDNPRFLDSVSEGDQLIVLDRVGAWYKVKTRDSRTGWVYSTFVEDR